MDLKNVRVRNIALKSRLIEWPLALETLASKTEIIDS